MAVDPTGKARVALHRQEAIPCFSRDFRGTSASHADGNYIGTRDNGRDYSFLEGSYERQVELLLEREYEFIDPPPE